MRFSLQATLLIWFLIGCYLNMSLFITQTIFVPNFIAYFFSFILLIIHLKKLFVRKNFLFISSFILVSILSIIFSPKLASGILKEQLLSLLQLILSIFSAMSILFTLEYLGVRKVSRIFFVFIIILLIGSIFERFIPFFTDFSDWFRNTFYSFDVYNSDKRDLNMVGFIRPKFFSREPSFLSQFLVLFIVFWHTLTSFKYKNILVTLFTFFSLIITGSPKIILIFPILFILNLKKIQNILIKFNIISIPLFLIIIIIILFFIYFFFYERILDIINLKDQSFNLRILIPGAVLIFALVKYPFFGVGLGAKENSLQVFNDTLSSYGYDWMIQQNFAPDFHSYFLEAIHFYGFIGLFLILWLFNKYLLTDFSYHKRFIFWMALIFIGLMGGSVVGIKTWLTISLLYFSISNMKIS